MTEPALPIASSSSSKAPKTPKKHKGKARRDKPVSPKSATRSVVDLTTPARAPSGSTSQGGTVVPASSSPSSSDRDVVVDSVGDFGEFDYDAVKADDGVELWLIRAPSNVRPHSALAFFTSLHFPSLSFSLSHSPLFLCFQVKAKNLRGLEINSSRTGLVGDLLRKNTAYDLWTLDPAATNGGGAHGSGSVDQEEVGGATSPSAATHVGVDAEELNHLSVLLPCKRKSGKLYLGASRGVNRSFFFKLGAGSKMFCLVQKPITRHLVVAARPAKPTKPDVAYEAPKREAYPDEVLTHRFRPYGDPGDLPVEDPMDVEMVEVSPKGKERTKRRAAETGSSKKKKAKLVASQ